MEGNLAIAIKNEMLIPSDPIIIHLLGIHHREILLQLPKDISVKWCLQEYLLQGKLERTQIYINSNWLRKAWFGHTVQYHGAIKKKKKGEKEDHFLKTGVEIYLRHIPRWKIACLRVESMIPFL